MAKTAIVDAGDKIDVYYSHEAKHWYGVVGGWYFHGGRRGRHPEGAAGDVKLNVGAGADAREITVPPSALCRCEGERLRLGQLEHLQQQGYRLVPRRCRSRARLRSRKVDDANDPDDGKLRVKVADLAGVGLEPAETGCELTVDPGCGIGVNADGVFVDAMTIAGPGLGPIGACSLGVVTGCGISVAGGFVTVDAVQLAGNGLSPQATASCR